MGSELTDCCNREVCWCGTPSARVHAMAEFSVTEFGHKRISSSPHEIAIIEGVAALRAQLAAAESLVAELERERKDLAMLLRRALHRMEKAGFATSTCQQISEYLVRKGLHGSVLRDALAEALAPGADATKEGAKSV